MNLRRLEYFIKIFDIGSQTQAADILHIAQPAAVDAGRRGRATARTRGYADQCRERLYTPAQAILRLRAGAERHR